ncbi:capping protein inhibiting regulator of actin dynamics-like isoform X1 [Montipora capricornis]|uniref:capping protein inhibiting regulator of actin dynamics-like isoform X1 n=1 Tax=Montipora capricornis TaxID=246305 RepID=UPI0035F138EB
MPTCMHIAYHNEAKRRQRVLDKKREALQRLVIQQQLEEEKKRADQEKLKLEKVEKEKERARTREEYIRSMGRSGRAGVVNSHYVNMIPEQKMKISQRDLRHQEKILRDNCLVMGHVNDKFIA